MNYFKLKDEELISLHEAKKINAIMFLYYKYRNFSYVLIYKVLEKTPYLNRLYENKDAIIIDSIKITLKSFNPNKGSFKSIYASILKRETIKLLIEFKKNPLSDCVSITQKLSNTEDLTMMDIISDDLFENPNTYTYKRETVAKINATLKKLGNKKIAEIVNLRLQGYDYKEIADKYNCSVQTIYALIYRFKEGYKKLKT